MQETQDYTPTITHVNGGMMPTPEPALTNEDLLALEAAHHNSVQAMPDALLERHVESTARSMDVYSSGPPHAHYYLRCQHALLAELQQRRVDMDRLLAHVRAGEVQS